MEVINTRTKEEYNELMEMYEAKGWKWSIEKKPTKYDIWDEEEELTCICNNDLFTFSDIQCYKERWDTIITFQEYKERLNYKIHPWDAVWVDDDSQYNADIAFKEKTNRWYIWKTKSWEFVVENKYWYVHSWKFISKKKPKEIEIKTKNWQTISISKEKAKELWFNIK